MSKHYHPFHLVDPSPRPYAGSFAALGLTTGGVLYMHSYAFGDFLLISSFTCYFNYDCMMKRCY